MSSNENNPLFHGYTPRYIIFNHLYHVKVKNIDSLDRDYIAFRGLPYTGIKNVDQAFAMEIIDKYVTISQMAIWFKQGVTIRFVSEDDIREIYEVIRRHIEDSRNYLNRSINVSKLPVDDLKVLSEFASELFKHISYPEKYLEGEKIKEKEYGLTNISELTFDIDNIFRPIPKSQEKRNVEEHYNKQASDVVLPKAPHEEVMADIEDKYLYRRQEWRPH